MRGLFTGARNLMWLSSARSTAIQNSPSSMATCTPFAGGDGGNHCFVSSVSSANRLRKCSILRFSTNLSGRGWWRLLAHLGPPAAEPGFWGAPAAVLDMSGRLSLTRSCPRVAVGFHTSKVSLFNFRAGNFHSLRKFFRFSGNECGVLRR
jgi:hypothetical protein